MQVPLNDEGDYDGGQLVWAVAGRLELPPRPAGSATIHTAGVVHGVTKMTRGVRYSLFLCQLPRSEFAAAADPQLQYLVACAEAQLTGFFQKALSFIETTSDAVLATTIADYHSFLLQSAAMTEAGTDSDAPRGVPRLRSR